MASLREIKDRIGSVRSTLKITSAMKLVASAKLRKAQRAIEALRPYERTLEEIYTAIGSAGPAAAPSPLSSSASLTLDPVRVNGSEGALPFPADRVTPTAVVAIASNSSLCGGFNANVVRKALETIRGCEGEVEVYPLGRKMAEALRRAGYTADRDYNDLVGHPSYEQSAALARSLAERFELAETYLPFGGDEILRVAQDDRKGNQDDNKNGRAVILSESEESEYLLEPDAAALTAQLLPQVMLLKFHAAILDSAAAEQAARTLAMQTATDNAEDLLGELTLEYNKGRQQKITAEILDLLGGSQQ